MSAVGPITYNLLEMAKGDSWLTMKSLCNPRRNPQFPLLLRKAPMTPIACGWCSTQGRSWWARTRKWFGADDPFGHPWRTWWKIIIKFYWTFFLFLLGLCKTFSQDRFKGPAAPAAVGGWAQDWEGPIINMIAFPDETVFLYNFKYLSSTIGNMNEKKNYSINRTRMFLYNEMY